MLQIPELSCSLTYWPAAFLKLTWRSYATTYNNGGSPACHASTRGNCLTTASGSETGLSGCRLSLDSRLWLTGFKVKVMLRSTVGQSIPVPSPTWAQDQIFVTVRQLSVCWCGSPSLTRRQVCHLQLLLVLPNAVILRSKSCRTNDHILLFQMWDSPDLKGQVPIFIFPRNRVAVIPPGTGFPSCCLPWLAGLCFNSPDTASARTQQKTSFLSWCGWHGITCSTAAALPTWHQTVWQHHFPHPSYGCLMSPPSQRQSTMDRWRSLCGGRFYGPPLTYIHTSQWQCVYWAIALPWPSLLIKLFQL
jgi:hypothetical protein